MKSSSYLNLRGSYSSAKRGVQDIKLTDYYSASPIKSSIQNPNSTRHHSALRKMAELYTGSGKKDYDIHDSKSRKHYSTRSESRDPLNQKPLSYVSPEAKRTLRKIGDGHASRESSHEISPAQRRHYFEGKRDIVSMEGVPLTDRSMRKNDFSIGGPSPHTLKIQRCEGSTAMKHSQRFLKTDPFSVSREPVVNPSTRTPPPRGKKKLEPNLGKAGRFYLGLPEHASTMVTSRPHRPGEGLRMSDTKSGYSSGFSERCRLRVNTFLEKNRMNNSRQHFSISRQSLA